MQCIIVFICDGNGLVFQYIIITAESVFEIVEYFTCTIGTHLYIAWCFLWSSDYSWDFIFWAETSVDLVGENHQTRVPLLLKALIGAYRPLYKGLDQEFQLKGMCQDPLALFVTCLWFWRGKRKSTFRPYYSNQRIKGENMSSYTLFISVHDIKLFYYIQYLIVIVGQLPKLRYP